MRQNNTDIRLERCRFEKNIASRKGGGGLLIKAFSTASLTDCIFLQNQVQNAPEINLSSDGGGGLQICSDSSATLRGCTFDGKHRVTGYPRLLPRKCSCTMPNAAFTIKLFHV